MKRFITAYVQKIWFYFYFYSTLYLVNSPLLLVNSRTLFTLSISKWDNFIASLTTNDLTDLFNINVNNEFKRGFLTYYSHN